MEAAEIEADLEAASAGCGGLIEADLQCVARLGFWRIKFVWPFGSTCKKKIENVTKRVFVIYFSLNYSCVRRRHWLEVQ